MKLRALEVGAGVDCCFRFFVADGEWGLLIIKRSLSLKVYGFAVPPFVVLRAELALDLDFCWFKVVLSEEFIKF
jgi:hypothetical protein